MAHVRSLNRVTLVGRVGRNPECTILPNSGREVARFSLATNEGFFDRNSNSWKDLPTEWHDIVAWGGLAQRVEKQVKKGDLLLIEGSIRTRKWTNKSGQEQSSKDIQASEVILLDKRQRDGEGGFEKNSADRSGFSEDRSGGTFGTGKTLHEDFNFEENEEPF